MSTSQHALGTSFSSPALPSWQFLWTVTPLQTPRSLVDPSARFPQGVELLILLPLLLKAGVASLCHRSQFTGAEDGTQGVVQATQVLYQGTPLLIFINFPPHTEVVGKASQIPQAQKSQGQELEQ